MDEEDSNSEYVAAPRSPQGDSKGDLDMVSGSLPIPYRPAGQSRGRARINCGHCRERDLTTYYCCLSCPNFDLCSNCVTKGCKNNPRHQLVQVRQSRQSPSPSPETMPVGRRETHEAIACNRCEQVDLVKYYRCRTCPDFDLCEQCYVDKRQGCKVNSQHRFDKMQYMDGRERVI